MDRRVRTLARCRYEAADRAAVGSPTTAVAIGTGTVWVAETAAPAAVAVAAAAAMLVVSASAHSVGVQTARSDVTCRVTGSAGELVRDSLVAVDVDTAAVVMAAWTAGSMEASPAWREAGPMYTAATRVRAADEAATSIVAVGRHRPVGTRPVLKFVCMTVGSVRDRRSAFLVSSRQQPSWSAGRDYRRSGLGRPCPWTVARSASGWSWVSSRSPVG